MDECVCGSCWACRRSLREFDVVEQKEDVSLGSQAQAIIDEKPPQRRRPGSPGGRRTTADKGVAKDRERERRLEVRRRRQRERVLVDGHWVHPNAPHGSSSAIAIYCCCCQVCRDANAEIARERRHKQARARRLAKQGTVSE